MAINKDAKSVVALDQENVKKSANFVSLYINSTRFAYTKWDIQMVCSNIGVSLDKDNVAVQELALITMSPTHAKAVLKALSENIRIFEAEHGEIIIPEDKPQKQNVPKPPTRAKKLKS